MKAILSFGFIGILLSIALCVGYVMNIYKITQSDWKYPYKEEIIRGIGCVVPYGAILGYIEIEDGKKDK